ncbi:MAG: Gfo/Idh/MocA family oxidoreductase [Chloroflexi bacterium]|nr:Gfo/Idh/MocA family oxidoreductase [Chloroflexota bacterium]
MAVIGTGAMGRNHVRVYREMPAADLVAVADEFDVSLRHATDLYQVRGYHDYREMLREERPEAVTVAVPTNMHCQVVLDVLEAGCDVLVEKPIAASVEEAERIVQAASQSGRLLTVGHIERYNPALIELKRRIAQGELGRVFQIHARRLGPFPHRVRDVGVVVDLATHDLDIMRYLTGSEVVRLYAETRREVHTSNEDLFNGMLRFGDDTLGLLEINWLTPTKIRELYVTGERGLFQADTLTQDLYFYENAEVTGVPWDALSMLRGVSEGTMTRYAIQKTEPLLAEQAAFLAAISGQPAQIVSGRDGLEALKLALALIESGQRHKTIEFATV